MAGFVVALVAGATVSPAELAKWKERGGASPKVLGIHGPLPVNAEPMNPRALQFKVKASQRDSCAGCCFASQSAAVCNLAGEQAGLRRLPACSDGFVYQLVETDARQQNLIAE